MTTNVYFIQEYVTDKFGTEWYVFVGMAIPTVAYILYVIYLVNQFKLFINLLFLGYLLFGSLWSHQRG